ncbi:MAG: hypothetical protein QNJ51_23510, partial [Calothrix sp. MO_167.B12]|nr:hypothetical protein [Calothrix sp. MO_167.B12]
KQLSLDLIRTGEAFGSLSRLIALWSSQLSVRTVSYKLLAFRQELLTGRDTGVELIRLVYLVPVFAVCR